MITTDEELLHYIVRGSRLKRNVLNIYYNNEDVYNYIKNRYNDTVSTNDKELFFEVYYRIKNNIDKIPLCPICGNKVYFIHVGNYYYYAKTCNSKICHHTYVKQKRDTTVKQKYNVDNPYQIEDVKKKIREKIYAKYGGFTLDTHSSIYNKYQSTMLNRYGATTPMKNKQLVNKLHNTFLSKYGVINPWMNEEVIKKCQLTQKQNGTFRKSNEEDECYKLLCSKFGLNNIIRQYKCKLYPFRCDFYIKSSNNIINKDLYIEYNGFFTHNNHLYDKHNIKDVITKCKWLNKAKQKPIYFNAIKTWTEQDVKKYNIAKRNNLNYLVFYNMKEFMSWYNNL